MATYEVFLSVGIDVSADFSFMSIALPNQVIVGKPFKIIHTDIASLDAAVTVIKDAETKYSLKSRIIVESTGVYHYPLYYFLRDKGFDVSIINPIISKSSTNINIRKVHNDRFDSKKLALLGLKPDLKTSVIPPELVIELRNLVREYYNLMDMRTSYINKLQGELRIAFPQYLPIFSKISVDISLELLSKFTSPSNFLSAEKEEIISAIRKNVRIGVKYAETKYYALIEAAAAAQEYGHFTESNAILIRLYVEFIRNYNKATEGIMRSIHSLVELHSDEMFVMQIRLLETITGVGFLSAITLMCEIGDFSVFKSPKQLFAYFGLDPSVLQSGKFNGTRTRMSKRGSRLARKALMMVAIVSIGKNGGGKLNNPILNEYYILKCQSKPKMVALGAVMHKICNIIFAILRDKKEFTLTTPQEHQEKYLNRIKATA